MISRTTNEVGCPLRTSSTWVRMLFAIVLWPCNTSCLIAGLAANRARREEEGGFATRGERHRRGTMPAWHIRGHMGAYTCLYARVCTPMWGTGLVGYQGNGCVGLIRESPAGGEASEAAPWQPPGQGGVCICAALAPGWIVVVEDGVCVSCSVFVCVCVFAGVCVLKALGHPFHLLTTFHLTPHACSHRYIHSP